MSLHTTDTKTLKRAAVLGFGISLVFVFLLLRILILQTVEYEKYQAKVISQITTETTIEADRGAIYDANGILLAGNVTTYRVFIAPRTIKEHTNESGVDYADMISHGLSELLEDVSYEDVHYQTTKTHYLDRTVARKVTSDVAKQIRELIKQNGLEDMVFLEATATRYYPYETLAAHTLGFTNSEGVGIYGLEYTYEEYLKGTDGKYVTARDADGNEMPYDYESMIPAAPPNGNANLTISSSLTFMRSANAIATACEQAYPCLNNSFAFSALDIFFSPCYNIGIKCKNCFQRLYYNTTAAKKQENDVHRRNEKK